MSDPDNRCPGPRTVRPSGATARPNARCSTRRSCARRSSTASASSTRGSRPATRSCSSCSSAASSPRSCSSATSATRRRSENLLRRARRRLAVVHRAVRQLRRGHGRGPGQGAGGDAAQDPRRDDGQPTRAADGAIEPVPSSQLTRRRHRRRVGRRDDPVRRRDHRGHRLGRRVGDHRRVGAGHPRGRWRPLGGHRRHPGAVRPDRRAHHGPARRDVPRPHDRPRRGRQPAEDAERDRPQHAARRADDHLPAGHRDAAAVRHLLPTPSRTSSCSSRCSSASSRRRSVRLLSAIGIAGMDRLVQHNVLAMSGRAVEAAGDCSTLLLDKTGTITLGNRQAAEFLPLAGRHRGAAGRPRPSWPAWPTRRPRAARSSCSPRSGSTCASATSATPRSSRSPPRPA